jgi:hypothetical protein
MGLHYVGMHVVDLHSIGMHSMGTYGLRGHTRRGHAWREDIIQKTVHRKELRGCGDLFIWFGGPLHKRFHGPLVCCLCLPQIIGFY